MITRIVDGIEVPLTPQEESDLLMKEAQTVKDSASLQAATAYIAERVAAYPAVGDQLDMMYKDKINGTTVWQDTISTIKTKFPKPVSK